MLLRAEACSCDPGAPCETDCADNACMNDPGSVFGVASAACLSCQELSCEGSPSGLKLP
jgi:hypothetical protein